MSSPKRRFWVSWFEPYPDDGTEDTRPREWPLANGVVAYWVSGRSDTSASLCAIIEAESEAAVKDAVKTQGWSPSEWRFIEPKPLSWTPGTRFPMPKEEKRS